MTGVEGLDNRLLSIGFKSLYDNLLDVHSSRALSSSGLSGNGKGRVSGRTNPENGHCTSIISQLHLRVSKMKTVNKKKKAAKSSSRFFIKRGRTLFY